MAKDDTPVVEFEDPVDDTGGTPVPWHDLTEESGVEVVEGDPNEKVEVKGPSYDELVAQIQAEKTARVAAEQKADPVAALQSGILGLKEALSERSTPQPTVQAPGESDEDFAKRLKETFFEDPVSHLDKWSQRKLGPVVNQLASMTQATLRAQAMMDPEIGGTYKRYSSEVDRVVAQRADRFTNPDVYRECVSLVAGRHINELMAEAAANAVKAQAPTPRATPAPVYSEPPGRPATRPRTQLRLTAAEIAEATRMGLDPRDYARSKYGKW